MTADMMNMMETNSPKTSPRGSRSPAYPRQDSTGTLKTTITLGKNPSIFQSGPFYLVKEPPEESELTGSNNLMSHYNLEHSYAKFTGKKVREELSACLPNLPGNIDTSGHHDNSSLRSLIEKPPITGKELVPLSGGQLSGFRLHQGPLPEEYRLMSLMPSKKKKKKKHKESGKEGPLQEAQDNASDSGHDPHKKSKKAKREEEKEKKKRKKEKKKKKEKEKEDKTPTS